MYTYHYDSLIPRKMWICKWPFATGLTELATKMAGMVQQSDHHEPQKKQMKERTMEAV